MNIKLLLLGILVITSFTSASGSNYAGFTMKFHSGSAMLAAPIIWIVFPQNKTYEQADLHIALNTQADQPISSWWYSFDNGITNQTFNPIESVLGSNGTNYLRVWANGTTNEIAEASQYFRIFLENLKKKTTQVIMITDDGDSNNNLMLTVAISVILGLAFMLII
jgi:hypothetical protein